MKDVLGGKGAGLAEMTNAGLPVPPGFTIRPSACAVFEENKGALTPAIEDEIAEPSASSRGPDGQVARLTPTDPLLVSVRSGAKFSMPGMMDTILNLGLNDKSVEGLKNKTGNGRFAYDSLPPLHPDVRTSSSTSTKDLFEHELMK
jgi:pyruvate,orthophosphate dikinase